MKVLYKTFSLLLLICIFLLQSSYAESLNEITTTETTEGVEVSWEFFGQSGYYRVAYDYYLEQDTTSSYLFSSEITDQNTLTLTELEEGIEYIVEVQEMDVIGDETGEKTQTVIVQLESKDIVFNFTEEEITTQTYEQLTLHFSTPPDFIYPESIQIRSNKDSTLLRIVHIQNKENTAIIYINEATPIAHETSYTLSFIDDIRDKNGQEFSGDMQYDFVSFIPVSTRESWLTNTFQEEKPTEEKGAKIDRLPDTGNSIAIIMIALITMTTMFVAIKMSKRLS